MCAHHAQTHTQRTTNSSARTADYQRKAWEAGGIARGGHETLAPITSEGHETLTPRPYIQVVKKNMQIDDGKMRLEKLIILRVE